jgi:hypothetical protein
MTRCLYLKQKSRKVASVGLICLATLQWYNYTRPVVWKRDGLVNGYLQKPHPISPGVIRCYDECGQSHY